MGVKQGKSIIFLSMTQYFVFAYFVSRLFLFLFFLRVFLLFQSQPLLFNRWWADELFEAELSCLSFFYSELRWEHDGPALRHLQSGVLRRPQGRAVQAVRLPDHGKKLRCHLSRGRVLRLRLQLQTGLRWAEMRQVSSYCHSCSDSIFFCLVCFYRLFIIIHYLHQAL